MNLAERLLRAGDATPGSIALIVGDTTIGYGELVQRAADAGARLKGAGVRPGDRVTLAFGNEPEFVIAYLAVLRAGAIAVPLDPGAPAAELRRELSVVEPSLELGATPGGCALDALPATEDASVVPRADHDVAVLLFTSGTAGPPAAAMLTHGNLDANLSQVLDHPGLRVRETDVALGVLPLFHVFGLNVVLATTFAAGAALVLVPEFHAREALDLIVRHHVSVIAGVPSMFAAWRDVPETEAPADSFHGVRLAVSGAAPLPAEVANGFRERFGIDVHEGYGLTEAAPIVTSSAVDRTPRTGSIGPPIPGVEVRLVDVDGADVVAGDPGEIWVRGPNVFVGYWDDAEATARVLTPDGWLRTGDIAVASDDGDLRVVDRAKDLVIVSGFNVYPAEVEDVLRTHPEVGDAAVVGVPSDRTGEALVAYVVPEPGRAPTTEALRTYLGERLARYKCPTTVELVDELPRTLVGKVLRRELRDDAVATRNPT